MADPGNKVEVRACERDRSNGRAVFSLSWRSVLLFSLLLLLSLPALSQDSMRVDVGLSGYYSFNSPTPVQVYLPAAPIPRSIQLEFVVRTGNDIHRRDILRADRFLAHVRVNAGQALDTEVPILIPQGNWRSLDVTASSADGQIIARVTKDFLELVPLTDGGYLAAIYCLNQQTCQNVQTQIAFGGSSLADSEKNKYLRLATFREARSEWWAYSAACCVVLAGPIVNFSLQERQALEGFLRSGGVLALLEDQVADKGFLAEYRQGVPDSTPIRVGRGSLIRVQSSAGKILIPDISPGWLARFGVGPQFLGTEESAATTLLHRTGVSFEFPRLRWLVIWLAIYLLVIGPVNFAILGRLKRLEWGWVTMCALSALFAAGFYLSAAAQRPKNYTVDNATVYWMDGRSPLALEDVSVRVSAPERGDVRLSMADDMVVNSGSAHAESGLPLEIGSDVLDKARELEGWNAETGSPTVLRLSMLRWSFEDFGFEGFHTFLGTVHWTSDTKLKNDTGIAFREALLLDFSANKQYLLPAMAPAQEVDLTALKVADIWNSEHRRNTDFPWQLSIRSRGAARLFSVTEVPYGDYHIPASGRVFAGVSDAPVPSTELAPTAVLRSSTALTLVYLGDK